MEKYGWFTLLKNERAYKQWIKKDGSTNGPEPKQYPCFAQSGIDGYENGFNFYLYPREIAEMHKEFVLIGFQMSIKVAGKTK